MKVDFIDEDKFIIYYLTCDEFRTEDEMKIFFKLLNSELKAKCNYEFHGFYEVTIYCCCGLYILEFNSIDDYGRTDFDITMLLNTVILFKFLDEDIFKGEKIYYKGEFYVEVVDMIDDIHLFEYGDVIYGKEVDEVLNNGILVSI